ncbi:MAG: BACON domain-containing protein, partial [Alistipes sp.]|nr:BACON domain-containing protein [Alistipes sp.]
MKYITYISVILGTLGLAACADDGTNLPFGPDNKEIAIGADGGTRTVRIASDEAWIATTDAPWITVSPANGRGTTECQLIIDSALLENPRRGVIRFQNQQTRDNQEITVTQEGYAYAITLAEPEVSVENFALLDERYFD